MGQQPVTFLNIFHGKLLSETAFNESEGKGARAQPCKQIDINDSALLKKYFVIIYQRDVRFKLYLCLYSISLNIYFQTRKGRRILNWKNTIMLM